MVATFINAKHYHVTVRLSTVPQTSLYNKIRGEYLGIYLFSGQIWPEGPQWNTNGYLGFSGEQLTDTRCRRASV